MPNHYYFFRIHAIYAFYNLLDSIKNLLFLLILKDLLYMISHEQSLGRRHYRQVKTTVVATWLAIQGFRQGLKRRKFLDRIVGPLKCI